MRIILTLRRPDETLTDLEITADATATVADVADVLYLADPMRPHTEVPEPLTLQVQDPGAEASQARTLDRRADLIQAGLRSGSQVSLALAGSGLVRPAGSRGSARALLRVLSGPAEGREFALPTGASIIGRGGDADVHLPDPRVSARHLRLNVTDTVELIDLDSAHGVHIGGRTVERGALGPADVVRAGDSTFSVIPLRSGGGSDPASPVIEFNRAPRVVPRFEPRTLKAPRPPRPPVPQFFPIFMLFAPLLLGGFLYAVTRSPYSLIFVVMMPVMATAGYLNRRLQNTRQLRILTEEFNAATISLRTRIATAQAEERRVRHIEAPSAEEAVDSALRLGPLLWTHRPEHPGFMTLRLGLGAAPSRVRIELPNENDALQEFWEQLEELEREHRLIGDVPILSSLAESGGIGIAGSTSQARGLARALVTQLFCLHSPADLAIAAITSAGSRDAWSWLKWVPHTESPHSVLVGDHLASGADRGTVLLSRIEELIEVRGGGGSPRPRTPVAEDAPEASVPVAGPQLVLVVEDDAPVDRARLVRIAESGPDVGVYVLWCAATVAALPAVCRTFVLVQDDEPGTHAGQVRRGRHVLPLQVEGLSVRRATDVARRLAPVVDVGAHVGDESDLPRTIPFPRLLGDADGGDVEAVTGRWHPGSSADVGDDDSATARGDRTTLRGRQVTLRGPVGHDAQDVFHLDLRSQGPHALVGGTTGSGKSEFLQSWVMGMATTHSPERVTFLFVDYKGGAAFADCVRLPHTVGLVTDLSPHLVRRALTSLRAELRQREQLLHRKRVKDLQALERTGDPEAPPSLIVVVDEFATLATEIPEFVDGVVDVAARGRSLGLHLILATQRPAGVIKDNLRANANLRIALRTADEADSRDILGDPMAAHFDPAIPGRAAVRTGPGRIETFQTAYAGGWSSRARRRAPIDVVEKHFGTGASWDPPRTDAAALAEEEPTDIARMVDTLRAIAERLELPSPRRPWLEELASVYDLSRLPSRRSDDVLVIGVIDVPEGQSQPTLSYLPDRDGNMAVFGTGGSGKSTTLRTIAISAASAGVRGGPVQVYGLDFAGSGLAMLEELPHVGAIISGEDEERIIRLLRTLRTLIDERAARFAEVGAGSIPEYREATGRRDIARILLLVDGIAGFREGFETAQRAGWFALFVRIATDGRQVGVHVVFSADRPGAVPNTLASSVQRRLVHRMANPDDYAVLGEAKDVLDAASPPGRALLDGHEIQVAVHGGDVNVALQAREVGALAGAMRRAGVGEAQGVARLPERVPLAELRASADGLPVLGLDDETLSEAGFEPRGAFMIAGPPRSGRTTAMRTTAAALRRSSDLIRLVRMSARGTPLSGLDLWDLEASDPSEVAELLAELHTALADGDVPAGRLAMFVDTAADFAGTGVEKELDQVIRECVRAGQFVVGESETSSWTQAYVVSGAFRSGGRGVLLQPHEADGDTLLGTNLGRIHRADLPVGRGYLIGGGRARKVQIALVDD